MENAYYIKKFIKFLEISDFHENVEKNYRAKLKLFTAV
jgi:hypothetical protein